MRITCRSTRTRCGKGPHGAVGNTAPCGPLPQRAGHLYVMRRPAEIQVALEALAGAGDSRPSSAALAVRKMRPCVFWPSRTLAGEAAVVAQRPSRASRPELPFRSIVLCPAGLPERTAPAWPRCASLQHRARFLRPRPSATPLHNWSVETDTQRPGATSRVENHAPRGAKPLCAAHLQR